LKLAEALGLLTNDRIEFIKGGARVRHRYADNIKNMHWSLSEMLLEEQTGRLLGGLFGLAKHSERRTKANRSSA
jgi:hypothetical protein